MNYKFFLVYIIVLLFIRIEGFSQINFSKKIIANNFILAKKIVVVDVDRDGDLDVVGAANDTTATPVNVAWFENDGDFIFTQHNLSTDFPTARTVYAADFDPSSSYLEIVAGNVNDNHVGI
jgi:hypothetical protein